MTSRKLVLVGAVLAVGAACGGKVGSIEGDGGGTHGGDAAMGGPGDSSPPPGDDEMEASLPPTVTCTGESGGGSSSSSGSGPVCSLQLTESCSDGTNYSVTCSCPVATCNCSESSPNSGSSGSGIPFGGCPGCGDPNERTCLPRSPCHRNLSRPTQANQPYVHERRGTHAAST